MYYHQCTKRREKLYPSHSGKRPEVRRCKRNNEKLPFACYEQDKWKSRQQMKHSRYDTDQIVARSRKKITYADKLKNKNEI